jgi:hypothetical protein
MHSKARFIFLIIGSILLAVWALFAAEVLSTPRDFSSPQTIIRLCDENDAAVVGFEVSRHWYDSDLGTEGSAQVITDSNGVASFPKVPANVALFTGVLRRAIGHFAMCGFGSGTRTIIYVRCHGLCTVAPKDKPLTKVGRSNQDADGVWFDSSNDSESNTLVHLSFPQQAKAIDYKLSIIGSHK